jgi:hypothetical protein
MNKYISKFIAQTLKVIINTHFKGCKLNIMLFAKAYVLNVVTWLIAFADQNYD